MKVRRAQQYVISIDTAAAAPAPEPPGWWEVEGQTCVAAYQPKGADDLAASYVNLANPGTNDAAPGVAPTFDAGTGWTFNGSDQYLNTGIDLPSDQTYSAIVRFSGAGTGTMCGTHGSGGGYFFLEPQRSGGSVVGYGNQGYIEVSPALAAGVLAVAGSAAYRDGAVEGGAISGAGALDMGVLLLGSRSGDGSPGLYWSGNIQAVAIYSTTLTAEEVSALTTRMQNL
jgi:hypothetical protein